MKEDFRSFFENKGAPIPSLVFDFTALDPAIDETYPDMLIEYGERSGCFALMDVNDPVVLYVDKAHGNLQYAIQEPGGWEDKYWNEVFSTIEEKVSGDRRLTGVLAVCVWFASPKEIESLRVELIRKLRPLYM